MKNVDFELSYVSIWIQALPFSRDQNLYKLFGQDESQFPKLKHKGNKDF